MNINEVSRHLGISKDTIRYWERIGLLPPIARNQSGYRDYSKRDQNWIYYIQALRHAGMSIERLTEFVNSYRQNIGDVQYRKQLLIEQRQQLLDEMHKRQETVDYLTYKIDHFEEHVMNQAKENDNNDKHEP